MSAFFQTPPSLANTYESDEFLASYVQRSFADDVRTPLDNDYRKLGQRATTDLLRWARDAEAHPPVHFPYDAWGKRVDRIEVAEGWKQLDRISAEEGIVAVGYEREHGALSRVDQFIRLYLFHPSSAIYSCPLAMSDGAARLIEVYGDDQLKHGPYARLISRDPKRFWTSGQWMTERSGGSDVSGTETIARLENGEYRLYGTKWFTSATTSQMAMTLARIEGAPAGSAGLSLFYLELRDEKGNLRNIQVNRLKDKLGTKALPTAELTLQGTPAKLVGDAGGGIKKISVLFNITRLYNGCCSVANMRRAISLARDYAPKRVAFGKPLSEHPLHLETLAGLEVEFQGAFLLLFRAVELLGKEELGQASPTESAVLRLLTPLLKLYTAKQCIGVVSEVLESFGGAGYVEDTDLPVLLRDSQVLSIWEGTTNVLSLDALRAIDREKALAPFLQDISQKLKGIRRPDLLAAAKNAQDALARIETYAKKAGGETIDFQQGGARGFGYSLARTYIASLLLEHAQWSLENEKHSRSLYSANRWCAQELAPLVHATPEHLKASRELALSISP